MHTSITTDIISALHRDLRHIFLVLTDTGFRTVFPWHNNLSLLNRKPLRKSTMPQTSNQKRECRILCRAANKYCRVNNLFGFGLLVSTVFVATINVVQVDGLECGTVNLYRDTILGGKEVMKDEWPFIAALLYSSTSKYFCGGTIISQKHVLTGINALFFRI